MEKSQYLTSYFIEMHFLKVHDVHENLFVNEVQIEDFVHEMTHLTAGVNHRLLHGGIRRLCFKRFLQ